MEIEKRYRKRYNKLFEDACEVEHRHLTGLAEALSKKEFKVSKEKINKNNHGNIWRKQQRICIFTSKQNRYTI